MSIDFKKNHFDLFHLPVSFQMDSAALDSAYREVQREVHPDKFTTASDAEKRLAAQWATRANEAYQTLKSPLNRGRYFLKIHGIDTEEESNTAMPLEFLMQQMEWREALDDADSLVQVELLSNEVAEHSSAAFEKLANTLDLEHDFAAGAQQVRALMFVERFAHDIDQRLEALGQ